MPRTSSRIWLAAAALIALVVVVLLAASQGALPADDKSVELLGLTASDEEGETFGSLDVGQTGGWSGLTIYNAGTEPVTLQSADLTGSDRSKTAKLVGVRLHAEVTRGKPDAADWPGGYADRGWTEDTLMPVKGHVLPPGEKVELLFLVKTLAKGEAAWDGVVVTYARGSNTYTTSTMAGFRLCSPSDAPCGASRG